MGGYTACRNCGKKLVDEDDPKFHYKDKTGYEQCHVEKLCDALNYTECPDCNAGHWKFWDGKDLPCQPYCPECKCYHLHYDKDSRSYDCRSCGFSFSEDLELPGSITATCIEEVLEKIKEVAPEVKIAGPVKIKGVKE